MRPKRKRVPVAYLRSAREVLLVIPLDAVRLEEVAPRILVVGLVPLHGRWIEGWIQQELVGECRAAPVARGEGHGRGEIAAGTVARNCHCIGFAAEISRVLSGPPRRGVAVLEPGREGMLRCPPVADGDYEALALGSQDRQRPS